MSSVRVPGRMGARSPQPRGAPWYPPGQAQAGGRMVRSRSVEVPLSRGLSFGHATPVGPMTAPAFRAPPPPAPVVGLVSPAAGFRTPGHQGGGDIAALALMKVAKALEAVGLRHPRQGGGAASRASSYSPPPQWRAPAPPPPSQVPVKAACAPALHPRGPAPAGTQSTQSLQSVSRCSTATSARTAEVSQPAARRPSADRGAARAQASPGRKAPLGPSMAQPSVVTLPSSTLPLAKVVPVPVERLPSRRECGTEAIQQKLDRVWQEVQTIAQAQRQSEELDQTKERAREMSGQLKQQRQETQEADARRQALAAELRDRARLAEAAEGQLQGAERRLLEAVEEHKKTKRSLAKAAQDLACLQASQERLEDDQRNAKAVGEAHRAEAEQMDLRCQELQRAVQDMAAQLRRAAAEAQQAEEEKSALAAELGQAQDRLEEAGAEAREQAARAEQLGAELQEAARRRQCAEDGRDLAAEDVQRRRRARREGNKENVASRGAGVDHSKALEDLQAQLLRERAAARAGSSPGAYLELARGQEEDGSLARENGKLREQIAKAQEDLGRCVHGIQAQDAALQQLRGGHGGFPQAAMT